MTAVQVFKQQRNAQLKEDMPRHLFGALIAMGVGVIALIAGLWATNPPAGAMLVQTVPTTGSTAASVAL